MRRPDKKNASQISPYDAIAIGVSFGGLKALSMVLAHLDGLLPVPVLVVQHHDPQADDFLARYLDGLSGLQVKEAEEKERLCPGVVYIAPANYHLLVEEDWSLTLSVDAKVNFSRPSIDVLFESCADVFGPRLIGVVLTGANHDGSQGLRLIKEYGGLAVVQDPLEAEAPVMPRAALAVTEVDHVVSLAQLAPLLNQLLLPHDDDRMLL